MAYYCKPIDVIKSQSCDLIKSQARFTNRIAQNLHLEMQRASRIFPNLYWEVRINHRFHQNNSFMVWVWNWRRLDICTY